MTPRLYCPWNSPGQNTGVGSCSLLQGTFPTQGLNPGLPHCRQILYQLSHSGKHKHTGVGSLSLLQWIFLTQELNRSLLHCKWILLPTELSGKPWSSHYGHPMVNPEGTQDGNQRMPSIYKSSDSSHPRWYSLRNLRMKKQGCY